jgi:hypothetical protein
MKTSVKETKFVNAYQNALSQDQAMQWAFALEQWFPNCGP